VYAWRLWLAWAGDPSSLCWGCPGRMSGLGVFQGALHPCHLGKMPGTTMRPEQGCPLYTTLGPLWWDGWGWYGLGAGDSLKW